MEIKRINDNQIRCSITEQEIEEMGFQIDEIIGNTEESQRFMHMILEKVEAQENIDMELTSPIVRAELLPDHSMTITFGGITDEEKKSLFDKMMQLMEHMKKKPEQLQETIASKAIQQVANQESGDFTDTLDEDESFEESTPFALSFPKLEDVIRMSKSVQGNQCIPESSLYKMDENYYLITDFIHFTKKDLQPFAFAALEHDYHHYASATVIAHIKEHGKCLLEKDAILQLMQL